MKSIVDTLDDGENTIKAQSQDDEEIMVPKLCAYCVNNVICSVLPTLISIGRSGIILGVEACPFNISKKKPGLQLPS